MNNLRQIRESRGLTQKQTAELIGIHPVQLCAYEKERQRPRQKMKDKIETILGVVDWETGLRLHTIEDGRRTLRQLVKIVYGLDDGKRRDFIQEVIKNIEDLKERFPRKNSIVPGNGIPSLHRTRFNGNKGES
ncbi:MAG: helix-turn-helix transcriptional regulator [Bacteroidales bacterium]|nr:helix-turn-helix transcriptional regulator [Bacteroidales bacterium]